MKSYKYAGDESLAIDALYRSELPPTGHIRYEDANALAERVRAGDETASEPLLMYLFTYVEFQARQLYWAIEWHSHRVEYLDLAQEGNEAILRDFPKVIGDETVDCPVALLKSRAVYAMRRFSAVYRSAILTPPGRSSQERPSIDVESLDAPMSDEGLTLADMLEEPCQAEPKKDYTRIYDMMEKFLTVNQRETLYALFGLCEHSIATAADIAREAEKDGTGVRHTRDMAFDKLHTLLSLQVSAEELCTLKEACQILGVTADNFKKSKVYYGRLNPCLKGVYFKHEIEQIITERQERKANRRVPERPVESQTRKLEQAYQELKKQGGLINTITLTKAARVAKAATSAYLYYLEQEGAYAS